VWSSCGVDTTVTQRSFLSSWEMTVLSSIPRSRSPMHTRDASLNERRPTPAIRVAARPTVLVGASAALILLIAASAILLHEPAAQDDAPPTISAR
jgi:hypothetical protein